ncbi:MAG: AAA family ATPase [Bryobacteraceae bacterium]
MNRFQAPPGIAAGEEAFVDFEQPAYRPAPPRELEALNIPRSVLTDLMLRHVRAHGVSSLGSLAGAMKVSFSILSILFEELRKQHLVEVKGSTGLDYSFNLTETGRKLATERSEIVKYTGPAPVSLSEYTQAVRVQAATVDVNRVGLRAVLSDLVVSDALLDQLGPALVSQRSLFLYGPSGNGKSSYSDRLIRIYQDSIVVPYAVEIDGQIMTVYDPVVHRPLPDADRDLDGRWVVCRRPCITAGGELVSSMLDIRFDDSSGIYVAPPQVKANNGIFIIDDFGRQAISPRELLNRWMAPLDRRVDYLSLSHGIKFEVPFELLLVFSTNLSPEDLADEAFLRRIPNKVYVGEIDDNIFDVIFEREATKQGLPWQPDSAEKLRQLCKLHTGGDLRACYPADIFRILHWISRYEERPVQVGSAELERAATLYFARSLTHAE